MIVRMAPPVSSTFRELLLQLGEEHDREVAELHAALVLAGVQLPEPPPSHSSRAPPPPGKEQVAVFGEDHRQSWPSSAPADRQEGDQGKRNSSKQHRFGSKDKAKKRSLSGREEDMVDAAILRRCSEPEILVAEIAAKNPNRQSLLSFNGAVAVQVTSIEVPPPLTWREEKISSKRDRNSTSSGGKDAKRRSVENACVEIPVIKGPALNGNGSWRGGKWIADGDEDDVAVRGGGALTYASSSEDFASVTPIERCSIGPVVGHGGRESNDNIQVWPTGADDVMASQSTDFAQAVETPTHAPPPLIVGGEEHAGHSSEVKTFHSSEDFDDWADSISRSNERESEPSELRDLVDSDEDDDLFELRQEWIMLKPGMGKDADSKVPSRRTSTIVAPQGERRPSKMQMLAEKPQRRSRTLGASLAKVSTERKRCGAMRLISKPTDLWRVMWDMASILLLCQDLIVIPLQVFDIEDFIVIKVARIVTAVFWSVDIFASFVTGYYTMGVVEVRPRRVAINYIKTWFFVDVLLTLMDWIFLLVTDGMRQEASAIRLGKMSRAARAIRLLRLMKLRSLASEMSWRIRSEEQRTFFYISKLILAIMVVNHILACCFYGISVSNNAGETWVAVAFKSESTFSYRYWTSLHWSLTQFTPASMEVVPENAVERFFTVLTIIFALITFSSFVSSITTAMTYLRNINALKLQEDQLLRRYLQQHSITPQLTSRVLHYLQERSQQNVRAARTKEKDVELFKALPESLKQELRYEAFFPVISKHPLFWHIGATLEGAAIAVCKSAIVERRLFIRDELFGHGASVTHMFFVLEGCLSYEYYDQARKEHGQKKVQALEWACEVALWSNSVEHVCMPFVAQTNTELLLISAERFLSVVQTHIAGQQDLTSAVIKYGELFLEELKAAGKKCRWLPVVYGDFDTNQEVAHKAFDGLEQTEALNDAKRASHAFQKRGRTMGSFFKNPRAVAPSPGKNVLLPGG